MQAARCDDKIADHGEKISSINSKLRVLQKKLDTCTNKTNTCNQTGLPSPPLVASNEVKYDAMNAVIPVVVISCNRVHLLRQTLDALFKHRSDRFPIIVSQDCDNKEVEDFLWNEVGDKVITIKHHKKPNIKAYDAIALHYGWALTQVFDKLRYDALIFVEDDMQVSVDFFEYFAAVYPILREDPTIYCASSWNDNGLPDFVQEPSRLYRTDVFPGLGWMLTKDVWEGLRDRWPSEYWDEFMRLPSVRNDRACIRPEISRNKNIGKDGTSQGQFFDYIARIKQNTEFAPFTKMDLSYLHKDNYDKLLKEAIESATVITVEDLLECKHQNQNLRIIYNDIEDYKRIAKILGIMSDEKEGRPRTSYRMVVPLAYVGGNTLYITPPEIEEL